MFLMDHQDPYVRVAFGCRGEPDLQDQLDKTITSQEVIVQSGVG
jgi:hypothetical protein